MAELTQWTVTVERILRQQAIVIVEADRQDVAMQIAEADPSLDWRTVEVVEDPEVVSIR